MTKIAINGFGRIGRAAFRILNDRKDVEIVAINDLTDAGTLAQLLKYDSVFRKYHKSVIAGEGEITVDGVQYPIYSNKNPRELPWKELDVDVVLECTGFFVKDGAAYAHIDAGAKRVIISAPAKGDDTNISTHVMGVHEAGEDSKEVISNASCTTNCISPVAQVMNDTFGITKALMTTIHSYTATQKLQDGPAKDPRKGRAAAQNMIPTTTGAAIATTKVIPALEGKFDGLAVRVPTIDVSLTDFVFVLDKKVTVEEVNDAFKAAAAGPHKGILQVTDEPLVSTDFIGNPHSSIVDMNFTRVVDGDLVKVFAWYDNEWGYANRLCDTAVRVGKFLS